MLLASAPLIASEFFPRSVDDLQVHSKNVCAAQVSAAFATVELSFQHSISVEISVSVAGEISVWLQPQSWEFRFAMAASDFSKALPPARRAPPRRNSSPRRYSPALLSVRLGGNFEHTMQPTTRNHTDPKVDTGHATLEAVDSMKASAEVLVVRMDHGTEVQVAVHLAVAGHATDLGSAGEPAEGLSPSAALCEDSQEVLKC